MNLEILIEKLTEIFIPYIDVLTFNKDKYEVSGRFQIKGKKFYFESQDMRNASVQAFKIYEADHYIPAYYETANKVHFINYDENFEKNIKEKLEIWTK